MAGLLSAAISIGSSHAATWAESFDGRFLKNYFVEPQDKGGGWSNLRINPAAGYSGNAGEVALVKTPARKGSGAMKCVRKETGRRMEFELVTLHDTYHDNGTAACEKRLGPGEQALFILAAPPLKWLRRLKVSSDNSRCGLRLQQFAFVLAPRNQLGAHPGGR